MYIVTFSPWHHVEYSLVATREQNTGRSVSFHRQYQIRSVHLGTVLEVLKLFNMSPNCLGAEEIIHYMEIALSLSALW